jgi:hypothetical protein
MACDVMEAVRPAVDAWLLAYLEQRTLRRQDFLELRNGQCRLMPDMAKELAHTAALWAEKLGAVVEGAAQQLYAAATAPEQPRRWAQTRRGERATVRSLPTTLTEQRRSSSRPRTSRHASDGQFTSGEDTSTVAPIAPPVITKDQFLREIVPALRTVPAEEIAAAVGLSRAYCAKVRAGIGLPDRKHWNAFIDVVQQGRANLPLSEMR